MHLTIFHLAALGFFILVLLCLCLLIFLKIKKRDLALIAYTISVVFISIITYSVLTTISDFTVRAKLSKISFTRDLKNEGLIITGRIENLTRFEIRKCYILLNITNKKEVASDIFAAHNVKNANMKRLSVSYTIEAIDTLPGKSYKDFSVSTPYPPSFDAPEFYNTLKCV